MCLKTFPQIYLRINLTTYLKGTLEICGDENIPEFRSESMPQNIIQGR